MKRRILSLLVCFCMVFAMMPAVTFASDTVTIKVTADKETACPGDLINYTVSMEAISELSSASFELDIPTGMTYVANSATIPDGLNNTLGMATTDWTEAILLWSCYGNLSGFASATSTTLLTFSCKVNDGVTGNKSVTLKEVDLFKPDNITEISETVTPAVITVTLPASTISIKDTYTGKIYDGTAIADPTNDDLTIVGSNGEVTYTYYIDEGCTTETTTANGAASDGAAPKNAGDYWVKATVAANSSYASATSKAKKFTIGRANYTCADPTEPTERYIGTAYPKGGDATASGVGSEKVNGNFAWYTNSECTEQASGKFDAIGSKTLYWKFTPASNETNYVTTAKTGSITFNVSLNASTISIKDNYTGKTYDGSAVADPTGEQIEKTGSTGAVTFEYFNDNEGTVGASLGSTAPTNAGDYWVKATVAADSTHDSATSAAKKFTIKRADYQYDGPSESTTKVIDTAHPTGGSTTAVGVNTETVKGTISWFTDEAHNNEAAGTFDTVGTETLYWVFTPAVEENNYITTPKNGSTTFTVTDKTIVEVTFNDATAKDYTGVVFKLGEQFTAASVSGSGTIKYIYDGTEYADLDALKTVEVTDAGDYIVKAVFESATERGEKDATFTINKADQAILSVSSADTMTYGDNLTLSSDGGSGDGAVTYEIVSGGSGAATIDDSTLTPTKAGTVKVIAKKAESANYNAATSAEKEITIAPKPVTITGLTAADKEYDGTATATPVGTAIVSEKVGNDDVTVKAGTASFADKNVEAGKVVTFTGYELEGTDKDNYTLSGQPKNVTANITAKKVTITGLTADNKVYDGTTTATPAGTAIISEILSGDTVTVKAGKANFADKNVGTGKTVTFTEYALEGTDKDNYALSAQPGSVTADITAKPVTIDGVSAANKAYDGNVTAVISGTATINGKIESDDVSVNQGTAAFDNQYAGTDKTVTFTGFTLSGNDAGNYNLSAQPANKTADITAATQTITVPELETPLKIGKSIDLTTLVSTEAENKASFTFTASGEGASLGTDGKTLTASASSGTIMIIVNAAAVDLGGSADSEYGAATPKTFTIKLTEKTPVTITGVTAAENLKYTGEPQTGFTGTPGNENGYLGNYEIKYVGTGSTTYNSETAPSAVGTYRVTIKVPDTDVDYTGTVALDFEIAKAELNVPTVKGTYTYTGSEQTLVLDGFDAEKMSVSGNTGTTANSYTATVTLKDEVKANYKWAGSEEASVTINWSIQKATPTVSVTFTKITEKDKTLADAALTKASSSVEGTLAWNDLDTTVVTQGTAYGWTFTPNDTANYNTVTGSVTPWAKPVVIGGGGLPAAPSDQPTQSGKTTSVDMSGSTVSKGGQTTTTVDKKTADKLVETAVSNKSEEIVISAVTKNQSAASSIKSSEVALPAETLQTIADKTNAGIVIKTDVAQVKLDNKAAEAVASQAQAGTTGKNETVSIVAEKVKEEAKEVRYELKVVTSSGEMISDFKGGNATVTVNVPKSLSNKNIVCVYIDENGYMHKMDGRLNSDGTYSFTTGYFSTYAIMSEEEVNEAIKEQKEAVKALKLKLRSELIKRTNGKKAVKLTWTNPSDIELDGVEIYRSVKKNSGYSKKPIYVSKSGKYINTAVKSGKKYYYKVRGFVTIDGEKVYTDYSYKAYRTVK